MSEHCSDAPKVGEQTPTLLPLFRRPCHIYIYIYIYIVIAGAATYRVWDTRAYLRFCHGRTDFRRIFLGSAYHKSLQMAVVLGYSYGTAGRKRIELSEIHSPPSPSTADRLPVCPAPRVYRRWWSLIVSDHPRAEETNQTERLINYFGRRRGERRSCFTGRVEQSVGCLSVCLSVCPDDDRRWAWT